MSESESSGVSTREPLEATSRAATSGYRRRTGRRVISSARGALGIAVFIVIWQFAPTLGLVNPRFFPPAGEVLVRFIENLISGAFWMALGHTVAAWGIGLSLSVVVGVSVGTVIGLSPFLRRATHSTIEFLRPIPSVALIPLAILLFGITLQSELLLIVYACTWIVLVQTLYGVADVDAVALESALSMRLGYWRRIREVVIPTALPYLFTGFRLAATVALILAITAEMIIGTPGLGKEVALAQTTGRTTEMYAYIIASGLVGIAVNVIVRGVEKTALFWHPSIRGESSV